MIIKGKETVDAIKFIRPNSAFTMQEDDYETLVWLDEETIKPTIEEINQAKIDVKMKIEQKANEKAALLEKLGITADEAALLLS